MYTRSAAISPVLPQHSEGLSLEPQSPTGPCQGHKAPPLRQVNSFAASCNPTHVQFPGREVTSSLSGPLHQAERRSAYTLGPVQVFLLREGEVKDCAVSEALPSC